MARDQEKMGSEMHVVVSLASCKPVLDPNSGRRKLYRLGMYLMSSCHFV